MRKELTKEQIELLKKPLPKEAVSKHPSKTYLSSIKAIYVTERLNDVFGIGAWKTSVEHVTTQIIEKGNPMVVVKLTLEIPEYEIYYESYGGNDNKDLGDAYKGATTDALTKIGSFMEIGIDVFKGLSDKPTKDYQQKEELTLPKYNAMKKTIEMGEKDKVREAMKKYTIKKEWQDILNELLK